MSHGYISVNERLETTASDVWALGGSPPVAPSSRTYPSMTFESSGTIWLEGTGFAKSSRSGGRFDSELKPVTPEIKTEIPSLILRLLREEDTEELYVRVDQNREHLQWRASWVDGTTSKSDTLKFVRSCLESAVSGMGFHYALLLEGEIVGLVTFNSIEKINRCATMGYWLAKCQTGRGRVPGGINANFLPRLHYYRPMLVWLITFSAMILKIGHFCFAVGRQKLRPRDPLN
jgi:Acetyltransferase (GNAT) domain